MDNSPTKQLVTTFRKEKVMHALYILIIAFIVVLAIGFIGYKFLFHMTFEDAVFNTTLTMSNLGIGLHEKTHGEKLFTGFYSLISGIFFLSLMSAIIAYIFTIYLQG